MTRPPLLFGVLLPAVLLVAGCVHDPFGRPYAAYGNAPPASLRGQCERAIYDDPDVQAAQATSAAQVGWAQAQAMKDLQGVKDAALQRCMSQRGGGLGGGGVEIPR
jgi:hypothetical protein